MNKLTVKNVSGGYKDKLVVKNNSFECFPKELTFIIGPNGCGKSTLLKCISQMLDYTGEVYFNDEDVSKMESRHRAQKIAMFSQMSMVNLSFTIYDTVITGRFPYLKSKLATFTNEDKEITYKALEMVGLLEEKDKKLSSCSGGQLQRVLIARLVAQNPEVVIIDEITNHLDFKYQIEVLDYIKKWAASENKIVLGVLHDINLVNSYADKVMLMKEGKLINSGTTEEILTKDNLENLYGMDVQGWYEKVYKKWFK
ncbi:ABC transporter ATP-binding protein [Mycoplasma sp. P36-A1]|uniref:ABC transporter ATP-binding protein n=1 Tax=Mycoplasma sp. P36-A1 TaxID=3252900 RepID=UPI003C2F47E8